MDTSRKSEIMLDLLQDLMSEMKKGAGSKLKPKAIEVEVTSKPIELEEDIPEHLEEADGHDEPIVEEDEDKEESPSLADLMEDNEEMELPTSGASRRLAKLAQRNRA